MDGFETCAKLKENQATMNIPIIMCTARGLKEDVMSAAQSGADDYIVKPFQKKTMLEKVVRKIGLPQTKKKTEKES